MNRILRVCMDDLSVREQPVPEAWRWLGGRGLTSAMVAAEVPPDCDPLGPENRLVMAPGLLTGTSAPCSGRLSLGAKSPLTGGIKESNVGGKAGQALARLGIRALVLEGAPAAGGRYLLELSPAGARLVSADDLSGMTNYQVAEVVNGRYGPDAAYLCIGPGGEQLLALATVAAGDTRGRPTRHAGRGGLGAVLAAKGIKAVVLDPGRGKGPAVADVEGFRAVTKPFAAGLVAGKKALHQYGTAVLVNLIQKVGGLPVRNFRPSAGFDVSGLTGETLARNCAERGGMTGHGCHAGCVIRCSNIYHDAAGQYLTAALEYETIALLGANCGLTDLDQVAQLDRACDDYGLDTMETGATLAVAMEGNLLAFGDFAAMRGLLDEMARGTLAGRLLGQGAYFTGKTLGVRRIPTVKGQSLSGYDPRALKGTGVTYATSPMGADHTAGNCLPGRTGLDERAAQGQVAASREIQLVSTVCDNLGLCVFVGPVRASLEPLAGLLSAFSGRPWSEAELMEQATEILRGEVEFNRRAGISREQNDLPRFLRLEALESGPVFDVPAKELAAIFDAEV